MTDDNDDEVGNQSDGAYRRFTRDAWSNTIGNATCIKMCIHYVYMHMSTTCSIHDGVHIHVHA